MQRNPYRPPLAEVAAPAGTGASRFQFIKLLALFALAFSAGAVVSPTEESVVFMLEMAAVVGVIVGSLLLVSAGPAGRSSRIALPLILVIGALAYPGHYLALSLIEVLSPLTSQAFSGISPQVAISAVESAVLVVYWFVLPCLLGVVLRNRA